MMQVKNSWLLRKLIALIESLRPHQWAKNVFLLPALVFSRNLLHLDKVFTLLIGIVCFSLVAGVVYLINDILDYQRDRLHPRKKNRPIASKRLKRREAFLAACVISSIVLPVSFLISAKFFLVIILYLLLQALYSLFLKHMVLLDVFAIAFGFSLRILAGACIINVEISSWFMLCGFLLSLFVALGKRRGELTMLGNDASAHRGILRKYTIDYVDMLLTVVSCATILTYSLYTLDEITCAKFGTTELRYTIPLVCYGIFRYLYLVKVKNTGDTPEKLIFQDLPLFGTGIVYMLVIVGIVSGKEIQSFFMNR